MTPSSNRGRRRKVNRGLPRRVYIHHGAYVFKAAEPVRNPATGKIQSVIRLARVEDGEAAMLVAYAALMSDKKSVEGTMPHVCMQFKAGKLGEYGKETQDTYGRYLDLMASDFEDFHVAQVTTKDCADFIRNNYQDKKNTAKKVSALLARVFRYAISELGLRQDNPMDQIDLGDYKTQRREKLPTHDQVRQIRAAGMWSKPRADNGRVMPNLSGPMFQCLVDMAYLCWARAIDVRTMKESQIQGDWIRIKPGKTSKTSGKIVDIFITPEIQEVIERARRIKAERGIASDYLFPSGAGTPYKKTGLFSMWDRARERCGITDDVHFKDLRALGATDAARAGQQKDAIRKRLMHTTSKTSEIYIKEAIPEQSEIRLGLPWKSGE